jgi:hypothetical protein
VNAAVTPKVDAAQSRGERWSDLHQSAASCDDYRTVRGVLAYHDSQGPQRKFGYDGYVFRQIRHARVIDRIERLHCLRVYHPPGPLTAAGKPTRVSQHIDDAWYRLIDNTLARLPWLHVQQLNAVVIDDRPILHGIAPFSRQAPTQDARDGHTIWLNPRLFTQSNHWGPGNYGSYWAYHVQHDGRHVDDQPHDHDLFSPVLIHEVGHLVNYHIINGSASDPNCPRCAHMCGDLDACKRLKPVQREALCASPYCTGFGYSSGTENWAEMYRWFYQGSDTRSLLELYFPACFDMLDDDEDGDGINAGRPPPWQDGLGDAEPYRKSLWESCGSRACKPF